MALSADYIWKGCHMRTTLSFALLVMVLFVTPVEAQKRNITETDLFSFVWIADPQVTADGARVAFVKVTVNEKKDGYDTSIWSVSPATGELQQLTNGPRDSSPRWSPDGRHLIFVRASEREGKAEPSQLFMLAMAGGDSFQLTRVARGASQPEWSPDGKLIAFVSNANADDLRKQKEQESAPKTSAQPSPSPTPTERESDVRVITRAVYRSNGAGYLDSRRPQHIWVVTAPRTGEDKVTPRQLTSGRFSEGNITWSSDSSQIYFTSDQRDEPYYERQKTDVFKISVNGEPAVKLTSLDMGPGAFSLSPNGKQVAFVASATTPVYSYTQPDLWVMDIAPGAQPRNLTGDFDFDIGGGLTGDNAAPRAGSGSGPVWTSDGRSVVTIYAREGKANVGSFDLASRKLTEITSGNQGVMAFRSTSDSSKYALLISTPTRVGDLYWLEQAGKAPKQLTRLNDPLFSNLNLTEPEEVWYKSFDGRKVQTWVQKPPDFDPNKKYPLILNIHGGPHAAYGYIFDHEFQWMAAKGYVVLYPNPRGSTTYGQDFGNIIQYNYPGDDYKDLMAGVDEIIGRGYIDQDKLGVTGGSGGGLLTNWTIGQTTRFAAAVSQRDIANWSDWWYTADFTLFQPTWFRKPPFESPEEYVKRSPITYVNNVKTPLMLILGETDYRTPTGPGGEAMFRALKYRKIPTVMVRFPNETHELSRSGQPWHRIERLQHIVGWFDHWLRGVPKPEYEVAVDSQTSEVSR
jgi:dipeptidyl aminopeptidase/acylaminoacyl peptidase